MGRIRQLYDWVDARLDLTGAQTFMGKAFPAEDSFLLGEVALICFVVLVLTGTFLGLFFEPSTTDVEYEGSVDEYQGEEMPAAFVSVLYITYEVPFGMLIRRMHHWAAHLFVASTGLHMLRVFFTGAYRNPREPNWLVGSGIAVLAMFAAYTGYALPFDEFASTAVGIGYNVATSIPIFGDTVGALVFGGEYPSSSTVPRLYFLHVFVLPLAIAVLLAIHMGILIRQKHTEAPRDEDVPGRGATARGSTEAGGDGEQTGTDGQRSDRPAIDREDDSVVVGLPAFPNQAAVTAVVFFLTMATLSLLAGFLPVHNVAEYGPNDPASTPSLVMPDWFLMWGYGFLKLTPSWLSFDLLGIHVSSEFVGGVLLPGLVFGGVFAWPFIDRYEEPSHFTVDPLERPWQTAVGITGVVFVMIASIAGMDVLVADLLGTETDALRPYLTVLLIAGPIVAGVLTYAILGGFGDDEADEPGGDFERDDPGRTDGTDGSDPTDSSSGSREEPPDVDERYSDADAAAGDAREGPP